MKTKNIEKKSMPLRAKENIPFSTIIGSACEAIVVIDENQKIILINQGAENLFGYAASEAVGESLDLLIPLDLRELHRGHVKKFLRSPEESRYMKERREVTARHKNGDIFLVEASIIKIGDDQKTLFAAIMRDIAALRQDAPPSDTFSYAIDQAGDIVFITDHAGRIEYVNPAFEEVTGYSKQEVIGKMPSILKSGGMTDEYYDNLWKTILSGSVMRAEVLDRKKDGDLFFYDQTISPLKDSQGKITHFVSTGKDITLRKRAEQEVQLLFQLTLAVAEAENFDTALSVTLKLVCETMDWDYGEAWLPSPEGDHLELGEAYYAKYEAEHFHSMSSQFEFKPGESFVGKVWQAGQAIWLADVSNNPMFQRAAYAREAQFKTAISIPVMAKDAVVSVLVFLSRKERVKDERMMALSSAITAQLGTAFQRKQSEEALRQSEIRLREAQRIAKMGNWSLDLSSNQLVWSDEIFQIFEIDQSEFGASYQTFLDLIHPGDREMVDRAYTASLTSRQPYEIVHRLKMPDGRIKYVEEHGKTFYSSAGIPLRSVGTVQDITERKQTEQELRESEAKWKSLFSILPVGVSIIDKQGGITEINPALEKILGLTKDEIMKGVYKTWKYLDSAGRIMRFEDLPSTKVIRDNKAIYNAQIGIVKTEKDQSTIWTEVSAAPLSDNSCVIVTTDITNRKQAEEALRISEEKYRMVADFTYDWEAWRKPDGSYTYISPACKRVTGHEAEEFFADSDLVLKITHPEDVSKIYQHRSEVAHQHSKTALEFEFRILLPDGETRWLSHTCIPVYGENGDFLGRRENNRDITHRKIAETQLRESEKRLREIVDAAPFGAHVFQMDEEGRLIFVDANESADQILRINSSEYFGKTFEEAFPYLVRTDLPNMYRRAANSGIRYDVPRFHYKGNKNSAIFEIHAIQIAPGRVVCFFRNISELDAAYDETIVGWSRAMDLRDKETEEHTERVTHMAVEMGRMFGFTETELLHIRWGALLHDIGKIGVPDNILLKPGALNEEEQALMRQHPIFAYEMLAPIRFLRFALDIPYCHHEKWDGSGYPRGLKEVEIPLSARIFALVDVWDALRSDRPYRQKWSKEKTTEYIRSLAGIQFDPALVDPFLAFVNKQEN